MKIKHRHRHCISHKNVEKPQQENSELDTASWNKAVSALIV